MSHGIDDFLTAIKAALTADDTGLPELSTANVIVWDGGQDPSEDIESATARCAGVSAMIYDLGGDADPEEADGPAILAEAAVELYVDPTKRPARKNPALRNPGNLRDAVMRCLHANPALNTGEHFYHEARVKGYKPVADPTFVVFRIRVARLIVLAS